MKCKLMAIFFVFLSFFSCNHRCTEAMDDAKGLKRDTALIYLWRYTNSCRGNSVDSGYMNLSANGIYNFGSNTNEYRGKTAWYSTNGSITEVGCTDTGAAITFTYKYSINGDSLTLTYPDGGHSRFIKVSKPILWNNY
jgi:hypothetical protein